MCAARGANGVLFASQRLHTSAIAAPSNPSPPPLAPTRTRSTHSSSASRSRWLRVPAGYGQWLADLKARIHAAQQRAALAVNRERLALYWQIGWDILERQTKGAWGDGILDRVSSDLRAAFPSMRGFSRSNLKYMQAFAEAWPDLAAIGQQPVDQLPLGHNLVLLTKLKDRDARLAYARSTLEHGWSRAVLVHHIEMRTVERQGKADRVRARRAGPPCPP